MWARAGKSWPRSRRARSEDGCLVFADLHYMLALTGDNRPDAARKLAARIAKLTAAGATEMDPR